MENVSWNIKIQEFDIILHGTSQNLLGNRVGRIEFSPTQKSRDHVVLFKQKKSRPR